MDTVIEFRDVCKAYGDHVALDHMSLSVGRGEFVTIVGASGGGKTTALKMVNGLVSPDAGQVLVNGEDVAEKDQVQLRRSIGYAIQGSVLFPHMTVEQNIAYVPSLLNRKDRARTEAAVEKWMGIVGLDAGLRERYPDELSGGQAQRVGIARALAASPEILLMDEPFSAVDELTRGQLQREIARIHRETGITVLFVTHDVSEALRLGTRVLGAVMMTFPLAVLDLMPDVRALLGIPEDHYVGMIVGFGYPEIPYARGTQRRVAPGRVTRPTL